MAKPSKELISQIAAAMGRKGGLSAARNMTPEQLRERALKGAAARWPKKEAADE